MPCCGSVGGCGARAVSCKTPIYFINIYIYIYKVTQKANDNKKESESTQNDEEEDVADVAKTFGSVGRWGDSDRDICGLQCTFDKCSASAGDWRDGSFGKIKGHLGHSLRFLSGNIQDFHRTNSFGV